MGYVRTTKDDTGEKFLEFASFEKRVPDSVYFGPCNSEELGEWYISSVVEIEMLFEGDLDRGDPAIAVAFMNGLYALDPNGWHIIRGESDCNSPC